MMAIAAAYQSNREKRVIKIDYSNGYTLDSLK